LVLSGYDLPHYNPGVIFCINRPCHVFYIQKIRYVEKGEEANDIEIIDLTKEDYFASYPMFNKSYSRLVFIASTKGSLAHNYTVELK
jgi:hypothetical protein